MKTQIKHELLHILKNRAKVVLMPPTLLFFFHSYNSSLCAMLNRKTQLKPSYKNNYNTIAKQWKLFTSEVQSYIMINIMFPHLFYTV